jgi:hypothetical protein
MAIVPAETLALAEASDRTLKFTCTNGEATYHRYGSVLAGDVYQRDAATLNGRVLEPWEGSY